MSKEKPSALVESFRDVRRCGTPLVAVTTFDQSGAIATLAKTNGGPSFRWDAVRGLRASSESAASGLAEMLQGGDPETTIDPVTMLEALESAPDSSMIFLVNAHLWYQDGRVSTGIGNLRDRFKSIGATLVLLGPDFSTLPAELVPDIVLLSDPLPDDDRLGDVIQAVERDLSESDVDLAPISDRDRDGMTSALRGLSVPGAEQQTFMSLRPDGSGKLRLDLDRLWERKVETVNAIAGLEMEFGAKDRDSVRGLPFLMTMFDRLFREENPDRPSVVLHIDEIDKGLGGSGAGGALGDSSGVAQDQVGQLLQTMEEEGWSGLIPVGPPGTGKTLVSKTVAGVYGVPYMRADLGALKDSFVGASEARIRQALAMVNRIGAGRVLVLATCNRLDSLPPELRRRFDLGIWYFDLPTDQERPLIWDLFLSQYKISDSPLNERGLTGAEIRNLCRTAWRLDCTLTEARKMIVPVYLSGAEEIAKLRNLADGRFISANEGGAYTQSKNKDIRPGRNIAGWGTE